MLKRITSRSKVLRRRGFQKCGQYVQSGARDEIPRISTAIHSSLAKMDPQQLEEGESRGGQLNFYQAF